MRDGGGIGDVPVSRLTLMHVSDGCQIRVTWVSEGCQMPESRLMGAAECSLQCDALQR